MQQMLLDRGVSGRRGSVNALISTRGACPGGGSRGPGREVVLTGRFHHFDGFDGGSTGLRGFDGFDEGALKSSLF